VLPGDFVSRGRMFEGSRLSVFRINVVMLTDTQNATNRCDKQDDTSMKQVGWPNGKALDYESRDCRFDPCVDQDIITSKGVSSFAFLSEIWSRV
jgi:hypothetical protein